MAGLQPEPAGLGWARTESPKGDATMPGDMQRPITSFTQRQKRFMTSDELRRHLDKLARRLPQVSLVQRGSTRLGYSICELVAGDAKARNQVHVLANALPHGACERASAMTYTDIASAIAQSERFPGTVIHVLFADWDDLHMNEAGHDLVRRVIREWPTYMSDAYALNYRPNDPTRGSSWLWEGCVSPERLAWEMMCQDVATHIETHGGVVPLVLSGHSKNRGRGSHLNLAGAMERELAEHLSAAAADINEPLTGRMLEGYEAFDGIAGAYQHSLTFQPPANEPLIISDGAVALRYHPAATLVEIETVEQVPNNPDRRTSPFLLESIELMQEATRESAERAAALVAEGHGDRLRFLQCAADLHTSKASWQHLGDLERVPDGELIGESSARALWGGRKALLAGLYHLEMDVNGWNVDRATRTIAGKLWQYTFDVERHINLAHGTRMRPVVEHLTAHRHLSMAAVDHAVTLGRQLMP